MNRFLDLSDLSDDRLLAVLERAKQLEKDPITDDLAGRTVGLMFLNPSVRTLASMQAGVTQLGGNVFVIHSGAGSWKIETRDGVVMDGESAEHVREAIPVLAEYADLLGVRAFAEGKNLEIDLADGLIKTMADLCPKPFVNLESALTHPCQSLADYKTLDDLEIPKKGGRFVLSWAYHPKALPYAVPASTLEMAARRGMDVTVLRPEGYDLPQQIMDSARAIAQGTKATISVTSNRAEAMDQAHVIYAKSWAAPQFYGRPELEQSLRDSHRDWCIDESWFINARDSARFMHCLPVRRNVKVSDEVLDGPRSVVVQQAGNRLHAQKALLVELIGRGIRQ